MHFIPFLVAQDSEPVEIDICVSTVKLVLSQTNRVYE